jgi:hypothetical protein
VSSAPKATGVPSPALVFDTLFAYQRTAALRAAIELDLFRAIGEGPGDVASINARRAGVHDRYETRAGSAFEVEFGGPYDIVLLTNFLHHFDPPTCVGLLKKVHASLRRGGRVAALEFVPNEDRVSPPMTASFSLTMLATTAAGDAYTLSELEAMYRAAGFADIAGHAVPTGPHTVVIGHSV